MKAKLTRSKNDDEMYELTTAANSKTYLWAVIHSDFVDMDDLRDLKNITIPNTAFEIKITRVSK